ncbi:MAG: hypothetical protein AUK35_11035 [Zetaproteobacteria bacterium CG2_30_46_52]|nr:MAG: hypothetical protein AUK35_11035 [Zetaproteobacteria bacterium CG2_30_46_52]
MKVVQHLLRVIFILFLALPLLLVSGCKGNNSETTQVPYTKKSEVLSIETEPTSYRDYALVSSGNIHVGTKLVTDGPLADVHANGTIQARALSLNIWPY